MLLAGIGGILTTLAAIPMAWLSVRAPGRLQRLLEATNYIVGALPGVVIALALVTITIRVRACRSTRRSSPFWPPMC